MATEYYNCKYEPEELNKALEAFYIKCIDNNVYPDSYTVLRELKLSEDDIRNYLDYADLEDDEDDSEAAKEVKRKKRELSENIKKLMAFREYMALRIVQDNPKLTGFYAFLLKQPKYGGWRDKDKTDNSAQITVNLAGVGGSEAGK